MLILACCSTGKGLTNSWMYRGIAINMAFELGLHRDLDLPSDNSNIQLKYLKNVHQRIWWNCYALDRMISVISGRPTSIDEEEFDTSFPNQSDGPENFPHIVELNSQPLDDEISLKFFIKFIELSQLYGKVSRSIYSVRSRQGYSALKLQSNIHHLGESLNAWYMSFLKLCPDSLNSSSPLFTFGVLQRIYYHTLIVLLYRPLLPRPKQPMTTFAKTYYENSINSALKLVELIHQNQSLFMASGSNFKLYPIIVAITILTLGASSSESDSQVKDNCREGAITTLKILGIIYTQIPLTCHAILSSIQMLSSNGIINEHNVEADWPSGLVTAFNLYHSLKSSFIDLNKDQLNKPQTSAYQETSQDHLNVGNQNITTISSDSPSMHTGSHSTPINSHSNPQTAQPEPYQLPPSNEQASLKRDISAVESSNAPIPAAAHMNANNPNQSPTNPTSRDISQSLLHNLQQTRNVRPMFHPSNSSTNYTQPHPGMVDSPMFQHTMQQQSSNSAPNYSNFSSNNLAASATFSQPNVMNSINPHQQAMEHPLWRMRNPGMTSVPNNQSVSPSAPQARPNDMPTSFPQVHPSMGNPRPMMGGPGMMNHLGLNNPNNMLQNYTLPPQLLNIHNQIRQQNYNQQGQLNNPNTLSLMDLGWNMDPSYQFNYPFNANGNNNNNNSNNENTSQNS
ncbi:hypothetical protein CONCODRAFT_70625 [Conidiobolus coronatus NRRL 28638]|uniref:Xylanolytic transcriptional activator regulatory domain-containing protein n=1 Tax=Conidiobolus coronatus (strain ATCC 28846 / CBS 209.66 / NRRL 28638) TaxID=796925 RepID=A0A137P630_CONC2|nr:hypothetical protein CONCODRAFT_70625 [Conidiobolus coronatus NRRL 28638]|eukprot:KXN70460.1 hypothetical protein CONCODRAFT_70625 [Conidiobolus coronatus NRRL 28638]